MKRSMPPLLLFHQTMMSISLLEPCPQSRTICQEDLTQIPTLPSPHQTVPNILNSRGDRKPSSVPPLRRSSRYIGVAIQGRGRTIQQSRRMVTVAITQRILLGISMLVLSTPSMKISDPTQAADEAPTQPPGHSTHPPLTLHTRATSNTTIMDATAATNTPPTTTWIEPAATPKRESPQKPSANSPADPTAREATTATAAANTA
jgi:hypothetical protein